MVGRSLLREASLPSLLRLNSSSDRRKRTVAVFFRDCAAADSAAWAEAKLAAHPAERVLTNDPASLTFEGCERFEAIESIFATQFGR